MRHEPHTTCDPVLTKKGLGISIRHHYMIEQLQKHRRLLICILLAIATVAVYLPVRNYDFANYDDDVYVIKNPHVLSGLSFENIKWGFTAVHHAYW